MMHHVLIALASNHNQEKNLSEGRKALAQILTSTSFTKALWTKAEGIPAPAPLYLNQLVSAETPLGADELTCCLKAIEQRQGRNADARREGRVALDLDLMEYDGERHHERDWSRTYMKQLLALAQGSQQPPTR